MYVTISKEIRIEKKLLEIWGAYFQEGLLFFFFLVGGALLEFYGIFCSYCLSGL